MRRPFTTERGERPFPVLGAPRGRVVIWARVVRDTVAMFLAPGPVIRRALLVCRGLVMRTWSTKRKTAFLLKIPEFIFLTFPTTLPAVVMNARGLGVRWVRVMR